MKESDLEIGLRKRLDAAGFTGYVQEYRFHPVRRWRFDFAWPEPEVKLAVEIQGGAHIGGRHTRGSSVEEDYIKFNAAAVLGWTVLQVTGSQVRSGYALSILEEFLASRKGVCAETALRASQGVIACTSCAMRFGSDEGYNTHRVGTIGGDMQYWERCRTVGEMEKLGYEMREGVCQIHR